MKDEFKNISKFSEKSLEHIWKNKKDDIWNEHLNKKSDAKLRPEFIKQLNKTRK